MKVRSFAVDKNRSNPSPRLSWSLDTSQSETTLKEQTGANEIKSISYPIPDELTVELLEAAVRNDKDVWNKYVRFVDCSTRSAKITLLNSLRLLFYVRSNRKTPKLQPSLAKCSATMRSTTTTWIEVIGTAKSRWKRMPYSGTVCLVGCFCMLYLQCPLQSSTFLTEAWQEHGVEPVGLDSQLTRVMYLFNKRKLNRKYRYGINAMWGTRVFSAFRIK